MLDTLSELPYVQYWLPIIITSAVALPAFFLVHRPHTVPTPPEQPPEEPVEATDPFAIGSRSEQRSAYRRRGNPMEIHYTLPGDENRPRTGYVLDRSVGGMMLMVPVKVAPGTPVSIRPAKASEVVPWIEIEVRSCRPSEVQQGQFDLGCQFVKAPPYSIMLLFG